MLGREALRVKPLWLLPEIGMAMCRVGTEQNHTARRYSITTYFVVRAGFAAKTEDRWIEPQRFLDYHLRIGPVNEALNGGKLPAKHSVYLHCPVLSDFC